MEELLKQYRNELIRLKYSENTLPVYCKGFKTYCEFLGEKHPKDAELSDIKTFLLYMVENFGISSSHENQLINSIKFYYENILNLSRITCYLNRPKTEERLPTVLSKEEITKMLSVVNNVKHQAIIRVFYGSGLRLSELINLKVKDIDSQRMVIIIRQGKGKKDRQTLLPLSLLNYLRKYYLEYKPKEYLFEGQGSPKYTARSIQEVIKQAGQKAAINKRVHPHVLRHTFATHLHESGTDLRYIQELLGHRHVKTTERYTHVSAASITKIISPLDTIAA